MSVVKGARQRADCAQGLVDVCFADAIGHNNVSENLTPMPRQCRNLVLTDEPADGQSVSAVTKGGRKVLRVKDL